MAQPGERRQVSRATIAEDNRWLAGHAYLDIDAGRMGLVSAGRRVPMEDGDCVEITPRLQARKVEPQPDTRAGAVPLAQWRAQQRENRPRQPLDTPLAKMSPEQRERQRAMMVSKFGGQRMGPAIPSDDIHADTKRQRFEVYDRSREVLDPSSPHPPPKYRSREAMQAVGDRTYDERKARYAAIYGPDGCG